MKFLLSIVALWLALANMTFGQQDVYRLRPEDLLHIQIYNEPQVNTDVPVGRDGNISAPFVGIVRAQGRTTAELADDLYGLYQKILRLKDPKVSVTVLRYRALQASIVGPVLRAGAYEFRPGDTVLSLFARGGGASQDNADLRRVTLRRAGSNEVLPVDMLSIQNGSDLSTNYVLEDGDELSVPENRRNRVLVQGMVQKPGYYIYHEPMRLADAISLAGGEVPTRTKFSQTQILRELPGQPGRYLRIQVNYVNFIRKGDFSQNLELEPGDIVYVPETNTPDLTRLGNFVNSYFILSDLLRRGIFGAKLGGL